MKSTSPLVAQLIDLVGRAEEANRFERMASSLLAQNHKLQDDHHQLCNMLGKYIETNGPLKLDLRDGKKEDQLYEIQMVPTSQLGKFEIIAIKKES